MRRLWDTNTQMLVPRHIAPVVFDAQVLSRLPTKRTQGPLVFLFFVFFFPFLGFALFLFWVLDAADHQLWCPGLARMHPQTL
jgi:hypothetical protein